MKILIDIPEQWFENMNVMPETVCTLDSIRAKIDGLLNDEDNNMYAHGVMDCLEIIDKYIGRR